MGGLPAFPYHVDFSSVHRIEAVHRKRPPVVAALAETMDGSAGISD